MSNNNQSKKSTPMKYNALKHGLFTKEALLPFENRRDYLRFRRNVIASLNPSNDLERHVANDIADDAWRVRRHDDQIFAQKQKLYDQLTPEMVAEMGGVPQSMQGAAPSWLTDMQHKISTSSAQFAQKVCDQYLDCKKNFASIPNLVAVHKQYAVLFYTASQRAKILGKREVINEVTKTMDAVWQSHTKELWELLEEIYQITYYQANWKTIRQQAQPWIESWYFLKESESSKIEHLKALGIKVRTDFRKQLQAYERLKKNQHTFSPLLSQLAIEPAVNLGAAAFGANTVVAAAKTVEKQVRTESQEAESAKAVKRARAVKGVKEVKEVKEARATKGAKSPAVVPAPAPRPVPYSIAPTPASEKQSLPPNSSVPMGSSLITRAQNSSSDQASRPQ